MLSAWLRAHAEELLGLTFHVVLFTVYRAVQRARAARDPGATLQGVQARVRAAWVSEVLAAKNGILGVQALRNSMMATLFFASNTVFLVIGTLTLTAQGRLGESFALLDPRGVSLAPLSQLKVLLLLLAFLAAFFSFLAAIRLFAHASVSISSSSTGAELVLATIDTAWRYQGFGVRCYYFAAPIVFWLFGTTAFVISSLGVVWLMHILDRPPSRS